MCGVFAIGPHAEAAKIAYLGLHALQHRGQEAAGIVTQDATRDAHHRHVGLGLVHDVFPLATLERLSGNRAIGHVRYSTAGGHDIKNAQPLAAESRASRLAVAHNGNLVNATRLRHELEDAGAIFSSDSDTEILLHLLARSRAPDFVNRLRDALERVEGAYTLVLLYNDTIVGVRDPHGFRPLVLGELDGAWVLASETCALELISARFVREIEPGEIVVIDGDGRIRSERLHGRPPPPSRACIFELVYFGRPNSRIFATDVFEARYNLGRNLARETAVPADLVIPVPDSGVPAALGYADEARIPFSHGLIRSHYVGRTFIEPSQSIRHFGVKLKLSAVPSVIAQKRVVVVDDSVVRGTTSRKIVKMVREAGAKEVHLRISSPPTKFPCFYGIDTPTRKELIAATHTVEEIARHLTADSLAYLSIEGLHRAAGDTTDMHRRFCNACFSGDYPIPPADSD